ncbi:MAG: NAD(P)H-hydrate dehydratase, partial [Planctomycetes bacterium]|nr:NAD(P)H-hydrate dehydratase [Planctomycetota bacterium]
MKVLPEREPEAHKGDYGRLLVVGGGSQYAGAPALVALAALRSGVDLATVAAPAETARIINSFSPDLITVKLDGKDFSTSAFPDLSEHLKRSTAVVAGPGLGTSSEAKDGALELARVLAQNHPKLPVMFDADGLKLVASNRKLLRNPNWVVTPHAGEFRL